MVAYTAAFLAAANLLALAQAAPAQPVCSAVITVITGSPIWVPRADPTTSAGWGSWSSSKGPSVSTTATTTKSGKTWSTSTWSSTSTSSVPVTTITFTPTTTPTFITTTPSTTPFTTPSTTASATPSTTASTTTSAAPVPSTCDTVTHNVFDLGASGSCNCEYIVNCNRHSPYNSATQFWERTSGEIVETLQACLNICDDNSACQAVVWSNQDGESASDYKRCYQTSGLPQPDSDGYGQLSYKGACSSTCANNYNTSG